jgi:hypothetical protein
VGGLVPFMSLWLVDSRLLAWTVGALNLAALLLLLLAAAAAQGLCRRPS